MICTLFTLFLSLGLASPNLSNDFLVQAQKIPAELLEDLPVQDGGRIKPLLALSQESLLFLTGKKSLKGLHPIQAYLGLTIFSQNSELPVVNVRNPEIRKKLGLKELTHFSVVELNMMPLRQMLEPILRKNNMNASNLIPEERDWIEVYHQVSLASAIYSGQHFFNALTLNPDQSMAGGHFLPEHPSNPAAKFLRALKMGADFSNEINELKSSLQSQNIPSEFKTQISKTKLEVFYLKSHFLGWAAFVYFILGLILVFRANKTSLKVCWLILIPLALHSAALTIRVVITSFAPVTNMYGTMVWVSLGVVLFSLIPLLLYKQKWITGILWIGAALILGITDSFPLVLSPSMDPLVAVLRSNFWLSTHVLTITISYAAFAIAMLVGNTYLIGSQFGLLTLSKIRDLAHLTYRMIQLGVFLLTVGIILGGVWADYSWGRFWGWDPKETWALIADLGYLALLHARFLGWIRERGLLIGATASFLLVIMAWYGVNFVLASGLHSYGFSSGGATAMAAFVLLQLGLIFLGLLKERAPRT
ncbi:MAG: cytochrome c biogenesis protein CcsA [Oligoflexia bacterium]|nr:cytochrome c biogenesis protein CcsA [Oligoflexia bacterium]